MLDTIRGLVASGIASKVTTLRSVGVHGGVFDNDSLQRYAVNSPCAVVICDGAKKSDWHGTNLGLVVDFACFIIVRGSSAEARDKAALRLVYDVTKAVHNNLWGSDYVRAPTNINWVNSFSAAIDKAGIAIQAVTWEQTVVVDATVTLSTLDDLQFVYTDFDLPESALETPKESHVELEVIP